ncbi:MAG: acyltransferase [Chloroflexi bacterium]|nr:acyltransferase [Chloroflexota bacterium]
MSGMTENPAEPPASLLSRESLRQARLMPWKVANELRRLLLWPGAWWILRGVEVGGGWRCYGLPIIQRHRQSQIRIGRRLNLRSTARSNPLGPNHPVIISARRANARLTIGDDFGMTGGSLVCDERISIGDRVWVGANTVIADTDFHPLDPQRRLAAPLDARTAPIEIGDDVFIGMNALILKGVSIGAGTVIGAGSVVRRDVPAGAIVAGNPAAVVGELPG